MAEGRIKDARNRSSRYKFMEGSRREAEMELKRLKKQEEEDIRKLMRKKDHPLASRKKAMTGMGREKARQKWKKKAGTALMEASKFLTKK